MTHLRFDRFGLFIRSICLLAFYQARCEFDPREGVVISWDANERRDVYALPDAQLALLWSIANPTVPIVREAVEAWTE